MFETVLGQMPNIDNVSLQRYPYLAGFNEIGGYGELQSKYMNAIPETTRLALERGNVTVCGMPRNDSFHMLRHPIDSDIPGPAIFVAMFFMGSWYWCTDQVIRRCSPLFSN